MRRYGLNWVRGALIGLAMWSFAPSVADAGEFSMSGRGEATYKKKKDAVKAREDAIRAALGDALYKALSDRVPADVLSANQAKIQQEVLPLVSTWVAHYEIADESDRDKTYTVVLSASFDEDTLAANLDNMGFSQDVGSRRTVAVMVDEFFSNDLPPNNEPMVSKSVTTHSVDATYDASSSSENSASASGSSSQSAAAMAVGRGGAAAYGASSDSEHASSSHSAAEAEQHAAYSEFYQNIVEYFPPTVIKKPRTNPVSAAGISAQLLKRDVRLVNPEMVNTVRNDLIGSNGMLLEVMKDPATLARRAAMMGNQYNVDAMMVGTTAIVYNGEKNGRHNATATLSVQIVDTTTGDIVSYTTRTATGLGANSEAAADAAAQRLGETIGMDMGDQLFDYWKSRDEKGMEITFRVAGVDSTRLNLLLADTLAAVDGAVDVQQRNFDRTAGVTEYVITTKAQLTTFKNDILRALYGVPDFANLEEEASMGSNWNFVVR